MTDKTNAVADVENVITTELNTSDEQDSDFESGFDNLTETPGADKPKEEEIAVAATQEQATEQEYVQVSKADYDRIIASAALIDDVKATQDKAFGKIGGVERAMSELQAKLIAGATAGEPIQATAEDFAELSAEYGPEIAELQITGLNRILSKFRVPAGTPIDQEQISKLVQEQLAAANSNLTDSIVQQVEQRTEMKILGRQHPDWEAVGNTPEFVNWVGSLPEAEKAAVIKANSEYDSVVLGATFDKYKAHLKKSTNSSRNEILEGAVTDKGDKGAAASTKSDDDFESGFNS
jgi:hypothetical protein